MLEPTIRIDIPARRLDRVIEAAQEAMDASTGIDQDLYIRKLHDALELALGLFGLRMPDPAQPPHPDVRFILNGGK